MMMPGEPIIGVVSMQFVTSFKRIIGAYLVIATTYADNKRIMSGLYFFGKRVIGW